MKRLKQQVLPAANLWQFFVIDVESHVQDFKEAVTRSCTITDQPHNDLSSTQSNESELCHELLRVNGIYDTGSGERFHTRVKLDTAVEIFSSPGTISKAELEARCIRYEKALRVLNVDLYRLYDETIELALQNMTERVRYEFVSAHGPRWDCISKAHPLIISYFTRVRIGGKVVPLANNGWIYNGNPLVDFAGPHSNAYLERTVIVWGDCVKLRYGSAPSDSPWLWQHMVTYTTRMAEIFHGFRIDNCHSTPVHVAQYFLDAARNKRPNLYVACELFTGSEEIDAMYVSQLGITALIREAMSAHDSWELGRQCHRHGGSPVGSFVQSLPTAVIPKLPGALFMDCTHDNETPAQKRTAEDALPNSAVVAMAVSAVGSVRGYDELINKNIDVVRETRQYPTLGGVNHGIAPAKCQLNKLHQQLALDGFSEIHVHQEGNIISVQRHQPVTHEAYYAISHTAFSHDPSPCHPVRIPGEVSEFLFAASLSNIRVPNVSDKFLHGLDADFTYLKGNEAQNGVQVHSGKETELHFDNFPPGSVLGLRVSLPRDSASAVQRLHAVLNEGGAGHSPPSLTNSLLGLSMIDLNVLLYRCDVEEKVSTRDGTYHLNNYGNLVYCGLQGFASVLADLQVSNDLGHSLCNNLREGNWMMDYIVGRLRQRAALERILSLF